MINFFSCPLVRTVKEEKTLFGNYYTVIATSNGCFYEKSCEEDGQQELLDNIYFAFGVKNENLDTAT
jgi:hypothetical protein